MRRRQKRRLSGSEEGRKRRANPYGELLRKLEGADPFGMDDLAMKHHRTNDGEAFNEQTNHGSFGKS